MDAEPAGAGAGRPRPPYQGVKWATEHTGVGRRTVHRRVDAWKGGDRTPYAIRSSSRPNVRHDRLIDPVDAERVRLQEQGRLDASITAEQWDALVAAGDVPWLFVTDQAWFRDFLGPAGGG